MSNVESLQAFDSAMQSVVDDFKTLRNAAAEEANSLRTEVCINKTTTNRFMIC